MNVKKNKLLGDQGMTGIEWSFETVSLIAILGMLIFLAVYYPQLPETIPVHFNATGQADGFGSKAMIWILPIIAVGIYIFITIGVLYPEKFNYPITLTPENTERQYRNSTIMLRTIKALIMVLFCYIVLMSVLTGLGRAVGLGIFSLPIFLVSILGTIGFYLYRAYSLK